MPTIAEDIKSLIEQGSLSGLRALAEKIGEGALAAERDLKFQRQAAHYAAKANRPEILKWLASIGADMESPDIDLSRPLHIAAMNGSGEACQALLALGAEADPARRDGKTPMMFAQTMSGKGPGFASCARQLAAAGANPGAADAEGKTAADHARELASAKLAAKGASELRIDPTQLDPTSAALLAELDKASGQIAGAFDDPTAPAPPPGPKTATSEDAGGAPNVAIPREEALKKLAELGFDRLGAADGEPPLEGRSAEVAEAAALLDKRKSVLLVGKAGVGKRSLARACAESLAKRGKIVMSVPSSVFRGDKYAGSVNSNIQKWLGPALSLGDELVLFINDAHQLATGKTSSDTSDTPMQILREQMDPRKDKRLTLLCATSPKELRALEEDDAFMAQLSRKDISGMDAAQALAAMKSPAGARQLLADHLGADPAAYDRLCEAAASLCDKYLFNQSFPGKAFEFAARALAQKGPEEWSAQSLGELFGKAYVVPREIIEGRMSADSAFYQLPAALSKKVIGQQTPIAEISEAVSSQVVLANPSTHKPVSMLFAGPTGVGKTEAATTMAAALEMPMLSLKMGEFTSPNSADRLRDEIAEFITKNYSGIVLVDEIEKSHPVVRDVLLNFFDMGVVGSGAEEAKCGFIVAVATTNVGAAESIQIKRQLRADHGNPKIHDSWIRNKMIAAGFRPEFVNRIDLACDFNDIVPEDAMTISKMMFGARGAALAESRGIELSIEDGVAKAFAADAFDADFGARGIRRCVDKTLQAIVADAAIALAIGPGAKLTASVGASGGIRAEVTKADGATTISMVKIADGAADLARLNESLSQMSARAGSPAPAARSQASIGIKDDVMNGVLEAFAQLASRAAELGQHESSPERKPASKPA